MPHKVVMYPGESPVRIAINGCDITIPDELLTTFTAMTTLATIFEESPENALGILAYFFAIGQKYGAKISAYVVEQCIEKGMAPEKISELIEEFFDKE